MKTKTRFNKLTAWLITLAMLMTFIPSFTLGVNAETITGTAGTVSYTIDEYGVMTISGSGTIPQGFDSSSYINPNHNQLVKRIVIEDGITGIGQQSLDTFYNLTSVSISKTVTSIGQYAFVNCSKIKTITYWGTSEFKTTNVLHSSVTPKIYVKTDYTHTKMFGKAVEAILTDTSKECTVKFDMNGYGTQVDSQYVFNIDGYNKVTKPTDPSAPEVKFEGWYKDSEFNTAWNFDTATVSDNTTIYAKWNTTPDHTVSFDMGSYGTAISDRGVVSGSLIAEPETPTNDDALFLGWYKDSNFETPWDFASDTVTSDTTLYAEWRLWYGTAPSTGDGSESSPFEIGTAAELYWFADYYNNSGKLSSAYVILVDDITVNQNVLKTDGTLNGDGSSFRVWQPIGNNSIRYVGTFDGQGHTISGLYFNNTDSSEGTYVGFIGRLGAGTVKNLEVADSYFKGYQNVGGIVGSGQSNTASYVENCKSSATVYASYQYAGGISGNYSTVKNSLFIGKVGGIKSVGAIYGSYQYAHISNCYYLTNCAQYDNGKVQYGIGTSKTNSNSTDGNNVNYFAVNTNQLASGEIAYKLQGAQEDGNILVWGQQLTGENADAYPTLGGPRVVLDTATGTYINSEEGSSHTRVRGYCCDEDYDEPVLVDKSNCASLGLTSDYIGYYAISNYGQLYGFAIIVNDGDYDANAVLTDNIVANENVLKADGTLNGDEQSLWQWNPILTDGDVEAPEYADKYEGTFDGNNKNISGLYYNNSVGTVRGLFGYVGEYGVVKNLGIVDSYFYGQRSVGAIAGYNFGTIENCYNESTIKAYPKKSTGMMNESGILGGIVGYNQGAINNCYNKGYISGSNIASNIGGIAGLTTETIDECYNLGVIDGDASVGGIVGTLYDASITNSYNKGNITASGYIGGITGWGSHNDSDAIPLIEKCWNSGTITATSNNYKHAGGIVGVQRDKYLTIKDCYNAGNISAKGLTDVGGIIGFGKESAVIETSYNCGEIVGATYTGGIIGTAYGDDITITNCYYLEGCAVDSGDTVQNGVGNETAGSTTEDVTGETTALTKEQMTDDTNWKNNFAGFDTTNVWSKDENTESAWNLPKLDNNSPSVVPSHIHIWKYELDGTDTIKATCTADDCTLENGNGGSVKIAAPDSLVYTGRAIEAKVTNELVDKSTEVNVVYTAASGSELTSDKPVNIDTYTATLTIDNVSVSVEYDITTNLVLNTNGGTINSGDLECYDEGTATPLPTDITKDGYAFAGWYENAEFTGNKVTEIASTETGNKEYFAKWLEKRTSNSDLDILEGGQKSYIYFGTYQQSSLGNEQPTTGIEGNDWIKSTTAVFNEQGAYYSIDPIKWRVLEVANNKAFMLSDKSLDAMKYHEENEAITWETSTIRSWLNGYGASSNTGSTNGIDFTNNNFINSAFSLGERAIISATNVVNDDNPHYNTDGGNDTTDNIFLLSLAEAQNINYGFTDNRTATDTRIAVNSSYVYGGGTSGELSNQTGVNDGFIWTLRSPGIQQSYVTSIDAVGLIRPHGPGAYQYAHGIRPAFNLNLSSVLFTSAAVNGKPETFGEVEAYSGNEYKLTIEDESRNTFTAELIKSTDKYGISYSNAKTGDNEYVSAIVKNADGYITHYGRLAKVTDASGVCEIDLSGVDLTNSTLYIFNEQYNGDYMTDYAGELKAVTVPEEVNAYHITNTLGNTQTSNKEAFRMTDDTSDYTAELTADEGYVLPESITVKVGDTELADTDYTYSYETGELKIEADKITGDIEIGCEAVYVEKVTFKVSGNEQIYESETARTVTITPIYTENGFVSLSADDFTVQYYEVDENKGVLKSVEAVTNAVAPGKYLYVIKFKEAQRYYTIENEFTVTDTTLPDISAFDNIGYMFIKTGITGQQTPIYFKDGTVNLKVGGTYTNELTDENTENTVTYKSSNESIVTVDETTGEIKAIGKGTATITATSTKDETTPVYASYTVNVGLATKTLTANDFVVTAKGKTYDGTNEVVISATVKSEALYTGDNIKVDITGEFADVNAGNNIVNYKITGISGTGAENYVLENGTIESTTTANITKATVTIICATTTTRTFDGNPQSVDVSAMANGAVFDSSNYTVKYAGGDAPKAVGSYDITVKLTEEAAKNYNVADFDATLIIKEATQEVFSIEGVPEAVYYGDSFTLSTDGANVGNVTYAITSGAEFATINGADVTVTGVGKVTITATSVKDGHINRVATKSFNAKQKVLTPTATATGRTYTGENGVNVEITLAGIVNSDTITATGTGTMLNADAGENKIVYVSGITLDGAKKDLYTLDTTSVQTTVNIAKIKIETITVSASDKKYGEATTAAVTDIDEVITADKGQVEVIGTAAFGDENVGKNKTVTFTASSLAGAKATNYYIDGTLTAETTATISPVTVNFVVGQTSFVYDGNDKAITLSASDEFGRIFSKDNYTVEYNKTPNAAGEYTATIKFNDENGNYTTTQGDITVTIEEATQDNLVIVGLPGTIQYGDSFELEAVGGEDGGTYEWTVKDDADITLDFEDENDKSKVNVTIGDVVGQKVEIEVTKKTENYEDISAKAVFVPTTKVVTFDISNLEQTYNGEEKEIEVDTEATTYTVTYNGSSDKPVNAGTYTVKVEANGNYSGMQTATLIIKKATATGTITGIADSYTYGEVVTGVSVTDLKADTEVKITYAGTGIYVPQDTPPTKVGNYTVIATITGDNYETLTLTENFEIKKATLTVKAVDTERAYGEANPIFKLVYTGFVNGETKDVLLAEPIATVNANASSRVDDYEIKVSGGSAENYAFSYDNTGKLTVKAADGGSLYITGSTNTAYVNDVFTLHAFYGNSKVNVTWESNNSDIAEIAANGTVTAKSAGTVTITAKADANFGNATATFELTVKQTGITLVPTGLVKTYTGERQDITFADNADFTPVLSGEGKNVDVTYTLISNPSVTEPIQAGTYSVVYTISDGSYTGGGNTTMYINKAEIEVKPKNITKVYGDEPVYELETTSTLISAEDLTALAGNTTFTSEGAAKTAIVKDGGYEITATLNTTENDNIKFVVNGTGTLTVEKAPLTVKVKDVSREFGAENPTLEAEYTGFKNEENENTENIFTGELVLTYDESITAETAVGEYADKTTASGIDSANYAITFAQGKVTVTKIGVTASAGTSRSSYLTVKFDKAVEGVTFTVTDGTNPVEITEVTASSDNKTYTLKGSFSTSVTYTVTPALTSETHEITSEALSIKPSSSGSSGGGGGGGSSAPATYTVKFETNGGSEIDSVKVTRNKTVDEPTEPTKDGYTFDGWYTDKELTKAYDFETKVTKAITLYAKWTENKVDDTDDKTDDKTDTPDTPVWENPFTDVNADDWYYENVEYAVENGLFNGTTETTFAPNGIITRAMMVTVLYRAEGEPTVTGTATFEDVDSNAYYAKAVVWGQQNGIIKGYSETEFAPDQNITREQIAAIMHRYAQYKGYDVSVGENTNILSYDDFDSISEYAIASMQYAVGSGLMKGKTTSTLNPLDNATRAEIAAILNRFIEANK